MIFGEIEFDEVSALPEGGYLEGKGRMKNEEFERTGMFDQLLQIHGFFSITHSEFSA